MAGGSKLAVGAAIAGNSLVAVSKFAAFFLTGSGAMLSEGIHSFADTLNQVLLMIGIVRSDRQADGKFRYGYHAERYVWALISAVGIFFLGCGVTLYHGIDAFFHPHAVESPEIAVGVLIFALIVEGIVLWVAFKALWKAAEGRPFWKYINTEADPSAVAVFFEDGAACLGVVIALAAIGLSHATGDARWDAVGSIVIGLLLGALAIWLIARNQMLLVGPSIPDADRDAIRKILEDSPIVEEVIDLRTRVLSTEHYRVKINAVFDGAVMSHKLDPALRQAYDEVKDFEGFKDFAHSYADMVSDLLGDEIDELERQIKAVVPKAEYIDIEAD